jgi:hypothetical protein
VVLLREDGATLPALQSTRPDGSVIWTLADGDGQPYAAAYHLPARADPAPAPDHPSAAVFGQAARLLGYSLEAGTAAPSDTLHLTLYWQALAPMDRAYTAFVHLLGAYNPASGGPVWAGHDGQPLGGHYATDRWQPGQVILDVHPLAIPADAPPGEYTIEAGLYLLETMGRLPAVDADGQRLADDAPQLGSVQVGE